jgi:hypothetical protein
VNAFSQTLDLAESYPTKDATLEAGDVVMLDAENPVFIARAENASAQPLVGVISTKPGFYLGGFNDELYPDDIKLPVALSGRVPVKVNFDGGDIAVGDRLTLSTSTPGIAMRATSSASTIGIALEPYTAASTTASSTILAFIDLEYTIVANQFYIDATGNVAIGTSTAPSADYKLSVGGDIAATGFINISSQGAKKDIEHLDKEKRGSLLNALRGIDVAAYRYNFEDEGNPLRLGLIAEEAPSEVLSADGGGIDLYKLTTVTLVGVQELADRIDTIEAILGLASATGASTTEEVASTTASSTNPILDGFLHTVLDFLKTLGVEIIDGLTKVANLAAGSLTVGTSEQPTGITIYDEVTGEPYCARLRNGSFVPTPGTCDEVAVTASVPTDTTDTATSTSSADTTTSTPTDTASSTPPTNPAPETTPVPTDTATSTSSADTTTSTSTDTASSTLPTNPAPESDPAPASTDPASESDPVPTATSPAPDPAPTGTP